NTRLVQQGLATGEDGIRSHRCARRATTFRLTVLRNSVRIGRVHYDHGEAAQQEGFMSKLSVKVRDIGLLWLAAMSMVGCKRDSSLGIVQSAQAHTINAAPTPEQAQAALYSQIVASGPAGPSAQDISAAVDAFSKTSGTGFAASSALECY